MAKGSQADLPEHGEAAIWPNERPTSNRSRNATCNSTTYMQEPCTERNNIAHESIERAPNDAYSPRGAQTNHASLTDPKTCSDQSRIPLMCAMPPRSHHMNAYDDERDASDRIKQRAQWRRFKEMFIPALSKRTPERQTQLCMRSPCEPQEDVGEAE